jgi:predicted helicase
MDYRIENYYKMLKNKSKYSDNEMTTRMAFQVLLHDYSKEYNYELIPELAHMNKNIPDATIKTTIGTDFGCWEAKDSKDDLEVEIQKKIAKGYNSSNIIYENTQKAVLFQNGERVKEADITKPEELANILNHFFSYQTDEIKSFTRATEDFTRSIPIIIEDLRLTLDKQFQENENFKEKIEEFLKIARQTINPGVGIKEIREIIIQHILTIDIFNSVFDEHYFSRENNIAKEVEKIIETFFSGAVRRNFLSRIQNYYSMVKANSSRIDDYRQKKKFLITIYEQFYKIYNPEAADSLGVVYTPLEVVDFMIESIDYLLKLYFNKNIEDKGVNLLDPATGTGTYISELLSYIYNKYERKYKHDYIVENKILEKKFDNEVFCNEISILPYYIATLDIEHTYQRLTGEYREFPNIVYADTLDNNVYWKSENEASLFNFTEENFMRLARQNQKHINVVIGNPPYNANQENANQNNKNRAYNHIDKRVSETYKKHGTATKEKLEDPFIRFFRWSTDRLNQEKGGIISFITNDSYIYKKSFDGFRKVISEEFNHIYILELGGDIYRNTKLSGTKHNVFGIKTGVAIIFLIKLPKDKNKSIKISKEIEEFATRYDKYYFLKSKSFQDLNFEDYLLKTSEIDNSHEWVKKGFRKSGFEKYFPVYSAEGNSIFKYRYPGINTARNEWVFDLDKINLENKMRYFIKEYNSSIKSPSNKSKRIKWSEGLNDKFDNSVISNNYDNKLIVKQMFRPFIDIFYYSDKMFSDRLTKHHFSIFGNSLEKENMVIAHSGAGSSRDFQTLVVNKPCNFDMLEKCQIIPLYIYDEYGNKQTNINNDLKKSLEEQLDFSITDEILFFYIYGVLNKPDFTKKFKEELKKGFPRVPIYNSFKEISKLGAELAGLHINYNKNKEFNLNVKVINNVSNPKVKISYNKNKNIIELDQNTIIENIPKEIFTYKLGLRSPVEWILDQYKPPTKIKNDEKLEYKKVLEKQFNTYNYTNYKEEIICLIKKLTTMSIETLTILEKLKNLN